MAMDWEILVRKEKKKSGCFVETLLKWDLNNQYQLMSLK